MARSRILTTLAQLERFFHQHQNHPYYFNYTFKRATARNPSFFRSTGDVILSVGKFINPATGKRATLYAMMSAIWQRTITEEEKRAILFQFGLSRKCLPGYQYSSLFYDTSAGNKVVYFPSEGERSASSNDPHAWYAVPGSLHATHEFGVGVGLYRQTPVGMQDGQIVPIQRPLVVPLRDKDSGNITGYGIVPSIGTMRVGLKQNTTDYQGMVFLPNHSPLRLLPIDSIDRSINVSGIWSIVDEYLAIAIPDEYKEPERKAKPIHRAPPKPIRRGRVKLSQSTKIPKRKKA